MILTVRGRGRRAEMVLRVLGHEKWQGVARVLGQEGKGQAVARVLPLLLATLAVITFRCESKFCL